MLGTNSRINKVWGEKRVNISRHYQSLSYLIGLLNIHDQCEHNKSMTNVSRKGSMFLILEIQLPWPKCIQQIVFSALVMSIQANYKKKISPSKPRCLSVWKFLDEWYAFFMSAQQGHRIVMTWVSASFSPLTSSFPCLSDSASPSLLWGYLPSWASFSVYWLCILFCLCFCISLSLSYTTFVGPSFSFLLTEVLLAPVELGCAIVLQSKGEELDPRRKLLLPCFQFSTVFPVLFPSLLSVTLSFFLVFCLAW